MRAFLLSLLFLTFNLIGFSQDYSLHHPTDTAFASFKCSSQDTTLNKGYKEYHYTESPLVTLRSQRSQSQLDSLDNVIYYIPVIFHVLTNENTIREYTPDHLSLLDPKLGERMIQFLNEAFSGGLSRVGEYPELGPGVSLNSQRDAKIRFIKGDRTIDGELGNEWYRIIDLDTLQYSVGPGKWMNADGTYSFEIPIMYKAVGGLSGPNGTNFSSLQNIQRTKIIEQTGYYIHDYMNVWVLDAQLDGSIGLAQFPKDYLSTSAKWIQLSPYPATGTLYKHVFMHELGHFFGLEHTFTGNSTCTDVENELNQIELDPTICNSIGDKICDTTPVCWANRYQPCNSPLEEHHCQVIEGIDNQSNNFMNYHPGDEEETCDAFYFTDEQIDVMRAVLETNVSRKGLREHGAFLMGTDTYCNSDPNACNYNPYYVGDGECLYFDDLKQCGGTCSDLDNDMICDDIDSVVDVDGTLDQNNNGIPDDIDPCGSMSEVMGIASFGTQSWPVPVLSIGNRCWSALNLMTDRFSNGEVIATPEFGTWKRYDYNLVTDNQNELPGFYNEWNNHPDIETGVYQRVPRSVPTAQGQSNSMMYNWYAVHDERGLCPSGWHVSTNEDWEDLERAIGFAENEIIRNKRESHEPVSLLVNSYDFLAYYWKVGSSANSPYWPDPDIYRKSAATGYLNRYGHRMDAGIGNYFWTTNDTKRNNSVFRYIQPIWTSSDFPKSKKSLSYYHDWRLNKLTSMERNRNSKLNAASVRCVKDID